MNQSMPTSHINTSYCRLLLRPTICSNTHYYKRAFFLAAAGSSYLATTKNDNLLNWLVGDRRALPGKLKIAISDVGNMGRGLIASETVAPGEVLLSLPLDSVFSDTEVNQQHEYPSAVLLVTWGLGWQTDETSHLSWSGRMAMKLLELRHQCNSGAADENCMCPWVASLPQHVHLPFLYFSIADLEECQDAEVISEAAAISNSVEATFESERERLEQMSCSWEDVQWAMSVLHSRCFLVGSPPVRTIVPGVDMANHSFEPSAAVRCPLLMNKKVVAEVELMRKRLHRLVHSPEAVQGRDAVEEVCAPPPPEPSRFELFAGDDGISAGSEVTISYGPWPNDVFYLFFGFVPRQNPWDVVVLFRRLQDMVAFHDTSQGILSAVPIEERVDSIAAALCNQHGITDSTRLGIAPQGYDERLSLAAQALLDTQQKLNSGALSPTDYSRFLALRCKELLAQFPTSFADDLDLRNRGGIGGDMQMSLQYRLRKKATLLAAIDVDKRQD